ncbi:MAG: glycosyltransferase family 2 protein, partial [Pseudomonadota bacterium]|nr:glycosyltransferase family 2 protein [Pseudomonadota bacterium]
IVRIFMLYSPLRFFSFLGSIPVFFGIFLGVRWIVNVFMFAEPGRTYIPSLILVAILLLTGIQIWVLGLVADLMAANRSILEEIRLRTRRIDLAKKNGNKTKP